MTQKRTVRREVRLLLCLAVLVVAAQWVTLAGVPTQELATTKVLSTVTESQGERDYIAERNTRTALLPELSVRLAPTSTRTTIGRQRTHASGALFGAISLGYKPYPKQPMVENLYGQGVMLINSRAVDYYIYALRHIII